MRKVEILDKILDQSEEFISVRQALNEENRVLLTGLQENQRLEFAQYLLRYEKRQVLVYSSDRELDEAYSRLKKLNLRLALIKADDIRFYTIEAKDRSKEGALIANLFKLIRGEYDLCLISAEALIKTYLPKDELEKLAFKIQLDALIDLEELSLRLLELGYAREHKVEGLGMFAIRGAIIDIYPPGAEHPYRIELFGDQVDSIRNFDVYTQKSIDKFKEIEILPSKAFLLPEAAQLEKALTLLEEDCGDQTSEDLLYDIDRIRNRQHFEGIEKYIPYLYRSSTIYDYLAKDRIVVLNDPNRIMERMAAAFEEFKDSFVNALDKGHALRRQGELLLDLDQTMDYLYDYKNLYHSSVSSSVRDLIPDVTLDIETRESKTFNGKLMEFLEEVNYLRTTGYIVIISIEDRELRKGLEKLLSEHNVQYSRLEEGHQDQELKRVLFTDQYFPGGSIYSKRKIAIFTKSEIYSPRKTGERKFTEKLQTRKIESFIELKQGDYVVHEAYGIGRFLAVEQKEFDGITKDYIKIAYRSGDSLYLPLEQMSKIQRYIGNIKEDGLKLSKLGGNEWKNTKTRAKKVVELIAQDLVDLYAKREDEQGYRYSEDSPWQKEFEEDFPFLETKDQMRAISEVKEDMESSKIMDRLLCGDVGYGKTEVALRAVFKASMDSKQTAFLVPTTVLAKQHYNTFQERFKNFPIKVELLSRFRTTKEQEKVIERLRTGEVDVLIGTHRILSKDIAFKDLGLIVVDEEQRFGVKDKEKLKKLRSNCDVLSLSATPIPRTLHMSLSGIRDISTLEEPPRERLPVLTYVMEAREGIISDAIMREVNRGGQVYFVYNRVQSIDKMHETLTKLLPGIRIAVAHGQMSARKLETILEDFTNKEYDVLLSTTIIETGMDIGNANTIIVYAADKMGLSQLYQLRGRVGRTDRQGYAYFMYEKDRVLTEVSEKRLKTIKEFTEFGSGFKVAMRDLEIRGAGTLLGETQHGHIADIGYELYVKMLEDAIKRLRGQEVEEDIETEIAIKVNAYIPSDYIEDEMDKIEIYKKIASIRDLEDKQNVEEEIEDRFSDIPFSVYTLTEAAYIRALGRKLKIGKISQNNRGINFYSPDGRLIVQKNFGRLEDYKLLKNIANYLEGML